jgi:hypothetical protein
MRRTSIVGPLLLIAIGALFLLDNLRPEISVWELAVTYWPFLLIAWGALRLIEILIWAVRRGPLPSRGLSGAEWTLVVFLCLFGSGAFAFHRHVGWSPARLRLHGIDMFGEAYDFDLAEKKIATAKAPRIYIENFRGNARIAGTDANEIRVSGRKTVRALQREDADRAAKVTALELVQQGDTFVIRTNQERADQQHRVTADLEITVPKGATIEARGRRGDFDISDINGDVQVESDNAGVRIQNVGGSVRANLRRSDIMRATAVKGGVEVQGQSDNLELENVQGEVVINGAYFEIQLRNLAKSVRFDGPQTDFRLNGLPGRIQLTPNGFTVENGVGPLVANTSRSKTVELTDVSQAIEITLDRGDVELRASKLPLPRVDVRGNNVDVTMSLPDKAKFELRATTGRGQLDNTFGEAVNVDERREGGTITGRTGDGPTITVNVNRGNLTLRKSSGEMFARPSLPPAEAPPPPPRPPKGERT